MSNEIRGYGISPIIWRTKIIEERMDRIDKGCILLSRLILENKIWQKSPAYFKIFIYILFRVNYKDGFFKTGEGLFNFSEEKIPGCTKTQIYEFLRWAKSDKAEILTTQKTTRGVIIKLNNYHWYQDLENYKIQNTFQDTTKTQPKHSQHYKKTRKQGRNNTHTNNVCVELSKEDEEILVNYAKKSKARNIQAYINTLINNGGYKSIIEKAAKKKIENTQKNDIKSDYKKVTDLRTACAFIGKYADYEDKNNPIQVTEVMKRFGIESYTHATELSWKENQ